MSFIFKKVCIWMRQKSILTGFVAAIVVWPFSVAYCLSQSQIQKHTASEIHQILHEVDCQLEDGPTSVILDRRRASIIGRRALITGKVTFRTSKLIIVSTFGDNGYPFDLTSSINIKFVSCITSHPGCRSSDGKSPVIQILSQVD